MMETHTSKQIKQMSYRELSEAQRNEADNMVFLLGTSLDEKVFFERDGQLTAVNRLVQSGGYSDSWGAFCYQCRTAIPKDAEHTCRGDGDGSQIYSCHTKEQADYLASAKSLRELLNIGVG